MSLRFLALRPRREPELVSSFLKLSEYPNFWRAYTQLGKIYYKLMDVHRTLSYWQQSLKINEDQKDIKALVAKLEKEAGL